MHRIEGQILSQRTSQMGRPDPLLLIFLYFLYLHSTRGSTYAGKSLKIVDSVAERGPSR